MPKPVDHMSRRRAGWKLTGVIVATALIAGTTAAAAVIAIDRPHRVGAGAWISDFVKSPGMAGLFALIAALIAFWGIHRQVSQSRRTLDHQQAVEQDRSWWTRFEWAAERAVPTSTTDVRLPWAAVVSTFDALASSARDDVQRRAVGAIMDVAASRTEAASESSTDRDATDNDAADREAAFAAADLQALSALRAYVNTTADTPAQSAAVSARLYEAEVLQALTRVFGEAVTTWQGGDAPDAVVTQHDRRVVIEIKGYTATPGPNSTYRVENHVRHSKAASAGVGGVVVAPVPLRLTESARNDKIVAVQWRGPDDDNELARAIVSLTS